MRGNALVWQVIETSGVHLSDSWLPPNAAAHGHAVDHLLIWNLGAIGILFLVSQLILVVVIMRRGGRSKGVRREQPLWAYQMVSLVLLSGLYVTMAVAAEHLWAKSRLQGAAPGALKVEVTGRQFVWYFRYPGPDGRFGTIDPGKIDAATGNPLGMIPSDQAGRDDVVASELVLPVRREVELTLRAQDVIHGFFVPAMRLKQNALPGSLIHIHFTPIALGTYPILCSQVCGLGHARMQGRLRVVTEEAFEAWLAQKEAERDSTLAGGQP